jgi:cytochrome c5
VGGLVRMETADGVSHLAYSCATCHAGERAGALVIGVPCETLDLGALAVGASMGRPNTRARLAWGPGRVDVTTSEGTEPVRIPDLRPVRDLGFLHHTGSVAQRDLASLAVRLETLIITSNAGTIRPPREVALGLAAYVWSLSETIPKAAPRTAEELRGQGLFAASCASCHAPPGYTGAPVALGEVGTDPALGRSAERGTGRYRVPSLRGVSVRGQLLHDGSLSTVEEVLAPGRMQAGYVSRRGGAVVGHVYGLSLSEEDRAALAAFLRTL